MAFSKHTMAVCCLHVLLLLPLQPLRKAASTLKEQKKKKENFQQPQQKQRNITAWEGEIQIGTKKWEETRKCDAWKKISELRRQNFPLLQIECESRKIKGGYRTYIPVELVTILNLWTKQTTGCPSISVPYGGYWCTNEQSRNAFPHLKPNSTSCFSIIA